MERERFELSRLSRARPGSSRMPSPTGLPFRGGPPPLRCGLEECEEAVREGVESSRLIELVWLATAPFDRPFSRLRAADCRTRRARAGRPSGLRCGLEECEEAVREGVEPSRLIELVWLATAPFYRPFSRLRAADCRTRRARAGRPSGAALRPGGMRRSGAGGGRTLKAHRARLASNRSVLPAVLAPSGRRLSHEASSCRAALRRCAAAWRNAKKRCGRGSNPQGSSSSSG